MRTSKPTIRDLTNQNHRNRFGHVNNQRTYRVLPRESGDEALELGDSNPRSSEDDDVFLLLLLLRGRFLLFLLFLKQFRLTIAAAVIIGIYDDGVVCVLLYYC